MRYRKVDTTSINLVGGIGNQLFTYFAGVYKSQVDGRVPIVNLGQLYRGAVNHKVTISDFDIPVQIINKPKSYIDSHLTRVFSLLSRQGLISGCFRNLLTGHYQSSDIGYDRKLETAKHIRQISGYFQSFRYFDRINDTNFKRLTLSHPSEWYLEMSDRLGKFKWMGIHVRRGDFKSHASTVGLLSSSYYLNAVEQLDARTEDRLPIVVFSDEIEVARELLAPLSPRVYEWICPPEESSASESLLLMSKASASVIANSTFSWWGAKLGGPKLVVAPKKWFKSGVDPRDIYPEDWTLVESEWLV
jgi:hypothetical protein